MPTIPETKDNENYGDAASDQVWNEDAVIILKKDRLNHLG